MLKYEKLPEHLRDGVRRYIERGLPPGHFLGAVICNDLISSITRADEISLIHLRDIVLWFYWEAPIDCWGTSMKMKLWISKRGLLGSSIPMVKAGDKPIPVIDCTKIKEVDKNAANNGIEKES